MAHGFHVPGLRRNHIWNSVVGVYRNPPKGGRRTARTDRGQTAHCGPAPAVLKKESSFIVLKSRDIWFATIAAVCLTVNEFSVFNYYVMYLKEHLLVP